MEAPSNLRPNITWVKGMASPNAGGRPKGLATYIREQSLDGRELADFLLDVIRGNKLGFKGPERIKACEILLNRGFGHQPAIEGDKDLKPILDLSKLTPQEIAVFEQFGLVLATIHDRVTRGEVPPQP